MRVLVRKEPETKLDGDGNLRSLTELHVGLVAPIWYTLRGPVSDPTFDCKSKHTESERDMTKKKKKLETQSLFGSREIVEKEIGKSEEEERGVLQGW